MSNISNLLFQLRVEQGKDCRVSINPFTPKSDQSQISTAASPGILHCTVWRTWLFVSYKVDRWLCYQVSLHHLYISPLKGWENVLFELKSKRVKRSELQLSLYSRRSITLINFYLRTNCFVAAQTRPNGFVSESFCTVCVAVSRTTLPETATD